MQLTAETVSTRRERHLPAANGNWRASVTVRTSSVKSSSRQEMNVIHNFSYCCRSSRELQLLRCHAHSHCMEHVFKKFIYNRTFTNICSILIFLFNLSNGNKKLYHCRHVSPSLDTHCHRTHGKDLLTYKVPRK